MTGRSVTVFILLALHHHVSRALPQNYDDIDLSIDQPKNEKVDIRSADII